MKKSDENIAGFFRWTTQPNLLSINYIYSFGLCISVKLKNLKANHNLRAFVLQRSIVVYIRKVKKSESKSQLTWELRYQSSVVYIRKVKKSESKSQHTIW